MKRVILHAGTHKTGTTALQVFATRNPEVLARYGIYYPIALHQQECYRDMAVGGPFAEAERAAGEVLSIPVRPDLTPQERDAVVAAVNGLERVEG